MLLIRFTRTELGKTDMRTFKNIYCDDRHICSFPHKRIFGFFGSGGRDVVPCHSRA